MEKNIFNFIKTYISEYGYAPTYQEIADNVGLKSVSSVFKHMNTLWASRHLTWKSSSPRTIKLLKDAI